MLERGLAQQSFGMPISAFEDQVKKQLEDLRVQEEK